MTASGRPRDRVGWIPAELTSFLGRRRDVAEVRRLLSSAPLEVPDPERPLPPGAEARYPGLALFLARAAAVRPGFALDAGNGPVVAAICHRLDGLPLAIELAAAQLGTLSLPQLAGGLGEP